MSRWSAICGDCSCMSPTFCAMTLNCSSATGNRCSHVSDRAGDRHRESGLHQRGARGKRTVDRQLLSLDHGVRRRAFHHARALRIRGQVNDERLWRLDRRRGAIDDLEQHEDVQRFVAHLEHESRLVDRSTTKPVCAGGLRALLRRGVGRDERDAHSAGRRHRELLRLEPLAIDDRGGLDACPRRESGELGAPRVVRLRLHHATARRRARRPGSE